MHVGDQVVVKHADIVYWQKYVGSIGTVFAMRLEYLPVSAGVRFSDGVELYFYNSDLSVVPPKNSVFQHNDTIKIIKMPTEACHDYYPNDKKLLNQIGKITGWIRKYNSYRVDCSHIGKGWFNIECLIPAQFLGEKFYLPGDIVRYENELQAILDMKLSAGKTGQILKIGSNWVPSSEIQT